MPKGAVLAIPLSHCSCSSTAAGLYAPWPGRTSWKLRLAPPFATVRAPSRCARQTAPPKKAPGTGGRPTKRVSTLSLTSRLASPIMPVAMVHAFVALVSTHPSAELMYKISPSGGVRQTGSSKPSASQSSPSLYIEPLYLHQYGLGLSQAECATQRRLGTCAGLHTQVALPSASTLPCISMGASDMPISHQVISQLPSGRLELASSRRHIMLLEGGKSSSKVPKSARISWMAAWLWPSGNILGMPASTTAPREAQPKSAMGRSTKKPQQNH
mmetsp:Transcript_125996/g.403407  ORF Transcript_125996/g.403407 Transcript_125996/m.403407 type:complete len:271 (+) Transcript_125996:1991-2803(+)